SLGFNLFTGRLEDFTSSLKSVPLLQTISLSYNYFYGTVPSFLVSLPTLTSLNLNFNYLTGSVPAVGTVLKELYIKGNYISSIFTNTLTICSGDLCCLSDPSTCTTTGTTQRTAAECSVCSLNNGIGPLCWGAGGDCVVAAASNIAAGTLNTSALSPVPPMLCSGGQLTTMSSTAVG
ncbi:unnamed protein product, partial [Closterium sp. Yama58-4]